MDLSDPSTFPSEFKSWLVKYLETHPPSLPLTGMAGYQKTPKITTGTFSDGPPSDPLGGDIWIASDVDIDGGRWQFQYNAESTSDNKWEFIGGSPVLLQGTDFSNPTVDGSWAVFGGTAWTAGRAGDYIAWGSWSGLAPVSAGSYTEKTGIMIHAGSGYAIPVLRAANRNPSAASAAFAVSAPPTLASLQENDRVALGYSVDATPSVFSFASIAIIPKRVS